MPFFKHDTPQLGLLLRHNEKVGIIGGAAGPVACSYGLLGNIQPHAPAFPTMRTAPPLMP